MLLLAAPALRSEPRPRAAAHANSLSRTRLVVDAGSIQGRLAVQVASLLEVLPHIDGDGDGALSAAESLASGEAIQAYLLRHYRLRVGTVRDHSGGVALDGRGLSVDLLPPDESAPPGYRDWLEVRLEWSLEAPPEDLVVEADLFWLTSPGHVDQVEVIWPGGESATFLIDESRPSARVDRAGRGALLHGFGVGLKRAARDWEHVALILGLALLARGTGRWVLGVFTAYLAGHGLGLGLGSVFGDRLAESRGFPTELLGPAAALAVAYVGADALFARRRELERTARHVPLAGLLQALLFGTLHGISRVPALGETLAGEVARASACAGLLLALALLGLPFLALALGAGAARKGESPIWRATAAALVFAGLYGFVVRL